jgi:hypothetical protein
LLKHILELRILLLADFLTKLLNLLSAFIQVAEYRAASVQSGAQALPDENRKKFSKFSEFRNE